MRSSCSPNKTLAKDMTGSTSRVLRSVIVRDCVPCSKEHVIQDDVLLFRHYRLYDPSLLTEYINYFHCPFRAVMLHQKIHLIAQKLTKQFNDLFRESKKLLRLTHVLAATSALQNHRNKIACLFNSQTSFKIGLQVQPKIPILFFVV